VLTRTQNFLSGTPSKVFCVPISTCIDPTGFFYKQLQPPRGYLAPSNVPQCARPLAEGLVIGVVVTSAANNRPKWIGIFVEGELSKFERVPQKLLCSSPHFVMLDHSEHGL
jgi:hypothetical protein